MSNVAASIRNDLKAAGFPLKLFSIRTRSTGSVNVEIKDASIPKARVEAIASRHEQVRREEGSGDILAGGNTFVSVRYSREALQAAGVELTARLRAGERDFGTLQIDSNDSSHVWHVWSTRSPRGEAWSLDNVARMVRQITPFSGEALAELLAERGELVEALATRSARAELDERRAHVCVALDLVRRALRELETLAGTDSVRETDAAMNEAATSLRLALGELE